MSQSDKPRQADDKVRIWSGEHRAWWGPDGCGYTPHMEKAGVYLRWDADRRTKHCDPSKLIEIQDAACAPSASEDSTADMAARLGRFAQESTRRGEELNAVRSDAQRKFNDGLEAAARFAEGTTYELGGQCCNDTCHQIAESLRAMKEPISAPSHERQTDTIEFPSIPSQRLASSEARPSNTPDEPFHGETHQRRVALRDGSGGGVSQADGGERPSPSSAPSSTPPSQHTEGPTPYSDDPVIEAHQQAREDAIWDEVIKACADAWPDRPHYLQSPIELIVRIIDERDEARRELAAARSATLPFIAVGYIDHQGGVKWEPGKDPNCLIPYQLVYVSHLPSAPVENTAKGKQ